MVSFCHFPKKIIKFLSKMLKATYNIRNIRKDEGEGTFCLRLSSTFKRNSAINVKRFQPPAKIEINRYMEDG